MAETTVTGKQILFRVAQELDEVRYAYIETVTSQTVLRCPGLRANNEFFKHGLVQVLGNGIRGVSGFDPSTETLTLSSAMPSTVAAGDVVEVIGWDAQKVGRMRQAINAAIDASYPYFYREVFLDADRNTLADGVTTFTLPTIESGMYEYDLPTDCMHLAEVGWSSDDEFQWYPRMHIWRTVGDGGALRVRFNPAAGIVDGRAGGALGFHYEAREPQLTSMDDETQLPLDYFVTAAMIYKRGQMNRVPGENEIPALTTMPFSQQATADALRRLGAIKKPLARGPKTGYWDGGR